MFIYNTNIYMIEQYVFVILVVGECCISTNQKKICILTNQKCQVNEESIWVILSQFNPLSANPTKWSNTLQQFVVKLPTNCLSVFDHFVNLALKGLKFIWDFVRFSVMHFMTLFREKIFSVTVVNDIIQYIDSRTSMKEWFDVFQRYTYLKIHCENQFNNTN